MGENPSERPTGQHHSCSSQQRSTTTTNTIKPSRAITAALAELVSAYRDTAPKLAAWLEKAAPEGLAVFALPEHHRRRMRTSNPMERGVQQELKRHTIKVRVFPNEAGLERLVSAVLV